ncbi:TadE/TadG family type IV pilus assembly protein [Labrenzia sp. 011]|uniref:TadE/TadG family type IV pilus assembly protein n=1 Tax=Labrenzia sp. 011 TaxID=2171494 RepID=UPI000D50A143|nr:TadE/TadG family type IV pilus assembly protein [Labrenzia sp. 011]PVB62031.1 pilus assembly protein TadG [Labrenzia sp. 011]
MYNHNPNSRRNPLKRLIADQDGAVLPLFGIMVILLIVIMGAAVDVSRSVNAREKLSYALDSAALSLAAQLSTTRMDTDDIQEALTDSFEANLEGEDFLHEAIENLDFVVDTTNGLVTVTSSATLGNYFVDLGGYMKESFGPAFFAFGTKSQVTFSRYDVELALVLDVTGSMRNDMDTLREASTSLVNILIPEDQDVEASKVRISLVPYSQGVNLGDYADKVKGDAYGYSDGSVCVTERQDYDDGSETYEVRFTDESYDYYDESAPPPKGTFYGGGSTSCSKDSEMIPLTSDRDTLMDAIDDLDDNGGTAGQTGIAWGWNSLSPNYADVWPSDSVGDSYDNDDVLKFAVIMTDGDNNRYYDFIETEWQCTLEKRGSCKKYEEVDVYEWQEKSESESYSNESSTASRALCDGMKAAGIEVFGVYFGSSTSSAGAKNMQYCASDDNYFQATSSADLIDDFSNIARKIQQIYLSK